MTEKLSDQHALNKQTFSKVSQADPSSLPRNFSDELTIEFALAEEKVTQPQLVKRMIRFHHPGYYDEAQPRADVLFSLPAVERKEGFLHHGIARVACAIVADNAW